MALPLVDSAYLHSILDPILSLVVARYQTQGVDAGERTDPVMLAEAFTRFMDVVARLESDQQRPREHTPEQLPDGDEDITELGEYAFGLMSELDEWVDFFALTALHESLWELVTGLALWVCRGEGLLTHLDPVVDSIAQMANNTSEPAELEDIYRATEQILNSVPPYISEDLDKTNPGRPWRVLNLNRAIVATRTHNTVLMEQAFEVLVSNLPEDAPQFFKAGMEQMDALNYPLHVREVMEKHFRQWNVKRSLH